MIWLLLALHPKRWRARYGTDFLALLEATPLTPSVVLDVLRNAAAMHARAHSTALLVASAVTLSALAQVVAVRADLTDNILWPPSTVLRALALAAVFLPWVPVAVAVAPVRGRTRRGPTEL